MIREALPGGLAGLLATLPMTVAMEVWHRWLPWRERYPLPPRQITMKLADAVGVKSRLNEPAREALTLGAHFSYGATAWLAETVSRPERRVARFTALAFGRAVTWVCCRP